MKNIEKELLKFKEELLSFKIPRWEELPDMELYMDQMITFIEKYLSILTNSKDKKIITSSMINNYVKLDLIPKPINKRYNKTHLAYLFAISILKHVFTIQEVRDGILFQANLNGKKKAYNNFCEEQENAIKILAKQINTVDIEQQEKIDLDIPINHNNLSIKMASLSFASKIIGERSINLQRQLMEKIVDNKKNNWR